jgi:hypothetical protein
LALEKCAPPEISHRVIPWDLWIFYENLTLLSYLGCEHGLLTGMCGNKSIWTNYIPFRTLTIRLHNLYNRQKIFD